MKYLGYEKVEAVIGKKLNGLFSVIINPEDVAFLSDWRNYGKYALDGEEAMKDVVRQLYEQHNLTLHPIRAIDPNEFASIKTSSGASPLGKKVALGLDEIWRMYKQMAEKARIISPFDLPISTIAEWQMVGATNKTIMPIPDEYIPKDIGKIIAFSGIILHKHYSLVSALMYAHEIAHTQTESVPGYTKNFVNREVISVFLEKAFAIDLDPSGELLKTIERGRMLTDAMSVSKMRLGKKFTESDFRNYDEAEKVSHLLGTILGTKLFDLYYHENDEKKKEFFSDIQAIFDGKMDVETMLNSRMITVFDSLDADMLSRHV